jgi:hypothetical protein
MRDQYLITVTATVVSLRTAANHIVAVKVELIIGDLCESSRVLRGEQSMTL